MRSEFKGARVLITGGLGFIGSNLARRLDGLGAEITVVDSLIPDYGGNRYNIEGIGDRLQVNISDVRDTHSLRYLVQGKDYLFNLAGQTSHLDSMLKPMPDLEINCQAQLSILETCRAHNPKSKSSLPAPARSMGVRTIFPLGNRIRSIRWTLTGSTRWRARSIIFSTMTSTAFLQRPCV